MAGSFRVLCLAVVLMTPLVPASAREPVRAPVAEPLQACPSQGQGFVRVPGSRSCIRLSGRVRAGLDARIDHGAAARPTASGRFAIDTRSETDYGPVRTFVRIGSGRP
ncbi:porin [Methylobacterium nigriterrae]|uniref:porin n=1 Tax=Methylobacterium nigriterrae TaxID=3127512 RepID=UPI003014158F